MTLTVAAVGCSGPVARHFVDGFLDESAVVRVLARDPASVGRRYPDAEVVRGSMMDPADVARVTSGSDAVFLVTPMGLNDDPSTEIEAARRVLAGVRDGGSPHLIYTSCLGVDEPQGVGILDAKFEIERLIRESGVPFSILRCGTYLEDLFDPRLRLLKKGTFLFPLRKDRRFTFTSQRDVPRFVVRELLAAERVLNTAIDLCGAETHSIAEIEELLSAVAGYAIRAPARFPTFHVFRALLPLFRWRRHRMSSVIPLLVHFDRHGYVSPQPSRYAGDFTTTSLSDHLERLLA